MESTINYDDVDDTIIDQECSFLRPLSIDQCWVGKWLKNRKINDWPYNLTSWIFIRGSENLLFVTTRVQTTLQTQECWVMCSVQLVHRCLRIAPRLHRAPLTDRCSFDRCARGDSSTLSRRTKVATRRRNSHTVHRWHSAVTPAPSTFSVIIRWVSRPLFSA